MNKLISFTLFFFLTFHLYPSYFSNCDVMIEVLENIIPETILESDNLKIASIQIKVKIISENSCHASDSEKIILDNVPYSKIKTIKKGTKILVHYSYANFDPPPNEPMSEIISWKFIRILNKK